MPTIEVVREGSVALLTINNPPANAVSMQVIADLRRAIDEVEGDRSVRSVVITGTGAMFSAGADVRMLGTASEAELRRGLQETVDLFDRIEVMPKAVIAAVNGHCLGGGCELAMACDIRIAAKKARLGQPEINLGITPGWGGMQRLTRLIGKGRAQAMLLSGDLLQAEEALAIGLVNEVVEPEELLPRARRLAAKLAEKAPLAIAEIKRRVIVGSNEPIGKAVREDLEGFLRMLKTKDGKEGIAAFLEKRAPQFKGE